MCVCMCVFCFYCINKEFRPLSRAAEDFWAVSLGGTVKETADIAEPFGGHT